MYEDELVTQRLQLAKDYLQHRIENEVRENAELHASLKENRFCINNV